MKALLIGGTGVISTHITRLLIEKGWDVTLLNRGNRQSEFPAANQIIADMNDEQDVAKKLEGLHFDTVCQFIAFKPEQVERDIRLFTGKTDQYIFISSASAYQKPPAHPVITESTPLHNPYWQYSRDKAACETVLMEAYNKDLFPITIVRPSHTFSERSITVPIHGKFGAWQVLKRMMEGKKVLIPGDGTSLWTVTASRDFAKGFVGLMGNVHAIGENVHITSDESLTWNQIMQSIARALNAEYKPCYVPASILARVAGTDWQGALLGDKANSVIFDNSKLKRLVPTFCADTRFDQAARDSVQTFLSTPALQKDDPDFDALCDKIVAIMEDAEEKIAAL
ncbi:MAG: SDR family oxidoreductase [Clostridiales bacterium]|nr:SDR family oxidoreductase [Clostridiales bacterium]